MTGKNGKGSLREARERWERDVLAPATSKTRERRPRFESTSGEEVPRLYTPEHLESFDYLRDAGFPGEFPFTRGVQPTMYRGRIVQKRPRYIVGCTPRVKGNSPGKPASRR